MPRLLLAVCTSASVTLLGCSAISLHDYDEFFELAKKPPKSQRDELFQGWLQEERGRNLQAIRPQFQADPVSYLVALADHLQDFGRMSYQPDKGGQEADVASLRLSYPCEAVEVEETARARPAVAVQPPC